MRRLVWDDPARVGVWVSERTGGDWTGKGATALGLERDGELIAGIIFDNYRHRSIAMHIAGNGLGWAGRDLARACFWYAFEHARVHKVIGYVDSTNTAARRFDEHLGFKLEAVITDAAPKGDLLIYSMTADECRWLRKK